jgi:hypothetical protein
MSKIAFPIRSVRIEAPNRVVNALSGARQDPFEVGLHGTASRSEKEKGRIQLDIS